MPGKASLKTEIGKIVELGKGIGRTKVIFKHFIGLRVPADICYQYYQLLSGEVAGVLLSSLSAALLQLVHLAIALSAPSAFYVV